MVDRRYSHLARVLVVIAAAVGASILVLPVGGKGTATNAGPQSRHSTSAGRWENLKAELIDHREIADGEQAKLGKFRVLRTALTQPSPSILQEFSSELGVPQTELSKGRWARVATREGGLWIYVHGWLTCIASDGKGGVSCSASDRVSRRGLTLGTFSPPEHAGELPHDFRVWGLAPNWARIALVDVGPKLRAVRIRDNCFALAARRPIRFLNFRRGARPAEQD
jgi:hypothetical protein